MTPTVALATTPRPEPRLGIERPIGGREVTRYDATNVAAR
jgi:hypothetical protein